MIQINEFILTDLQCITLTSTTLTALHGQTDVCSMILFTSNPSTALLLALILCVLKKEMKMSNPVVIFNEITTEERMSLWLYYLCRSFIIFGEHNSTLGNLCVLSNCVHYLSGLSNSSTYIDSHFLSWVKDTVLTFSIASVAIWNRTDLH